MTDSFGAAPEPTSTTRTPTPPPAAGPASTPPPLPPPAPSWGPRRDARRHEEHGHGASVVFGLIVLAIGLWFFATTTLGLDLPRIEWRQLWPVILIALGAWIVLNSIWRRR